MMHQSHENTKQFESKVVNFRKSEDPTSFLCANKEYLAESLAFRKRVETQRTLHGAVALNLFSGMGALLVALKRLSIALENKFIHCEIDKAATHVFKKEHKDPNAEWVHHKSFKEIQQG